MTEYFGRFIGTSAAIQKTYRKIKNIAPSNRPVFITGEVGTGKNICAEAIHFYSHHHNKKFITFNCSQDANLKIKEKESTLFFDQILKAPKDKKNQILDFLKNIGNGQENNFNTRIICSAQSDLYKTPQQQEFLKQLKTRLNYFLIEIPPYENERETLSISRTYI